MLICDGCGLSLRPEAISELRHCGDLLYTAFFGTLRVLLGAMAALNSENACAVPDAFTTDVSCMQWQEGQAKSTRASDGGCKAACNAAEAA
jgi:hypothetical protein